MKSRLSLGLALAAFSLSACASPVSGPQIKVEDAWARPASAGFNGAVYFRLVNEGDQADRLLGVQGPLAQAAEVHETMQMGNDIMSMQAASAVEVPAGGEVEFAPGGLHIMLIALEQPLESGDIVSLVLRFETSGDVTVAAPPQPTMNTNENPSTNKAACAKVASRRSEDAEIGAAAGWLMGTTHRS